MRKYKTYHTSLKILTQRGSLPNTYLEEINRSTIWRWKQEPGNKYVGTELSDIKVLENFINQKEANKVMRLYLKAALSIGSILNTCKLFHQGLKNNKAKLVKTILKHKKAINLNLMLKVLT